MTGEDSAVADADRHLAHDPDHLLEESLNGGVSKDGIPSIDEPSFAGIDITGDCSARGVEFQGRDNVDDDDVSFRDATIGGDVDFFSATFRYAEFSDATVAGDASFVSTAFDDDAVFDDVQVGGGASFDEARFRDDASFGGAAFEGSLAGVGYSLRWHGSVSGSSGAFSLRHGGAALGIAKDFGAGILAPTPRLTARWKHPLPLGSVDFRLKSMPSERTASTHVNWSLEW